MIRSSNSTVERDYLGDIIWQSIQRTQQNEGKKSTQILTYTANNHVKRTEMILTKKFSSRNLRSKNHVILRLLLFENNEAIESSKNESLSHGHSQIHVTDV